MESIRPARNSRLKSEHAKIDADSAGRRLQQSVRDDYRHAVSSNEYGEQRLRQGPAPQGVLLPQPPRCGAARADLVRSPAW